MMVASAVSCFQEHQSQNVRRLAIPASNCEGRMNLDIVENRLDAHTESPRNRQNRAAVNQTALLAALQIPG